MGQSESWMNFGTLPFGAKGGKKGGGEEFGQAFFLSFFCSPCAVPWLSLFAGAYPSKAKTLSALCLHCAHNQLPSDVPSRWHKQKLKRQFGNTSGLSCTVFAFRIFYSLLKK